MSIYDKIELQEDQDVEHPCKGLVFRGFSSTYFCNGVLCRKEGIRLLKKKSCKGCDKCGFMLDELREMVLHTIIPEIENGSLYTIRVTNISRDWESGVVDDYDLEVVKLP